MHLPAISTQSLLLILFQLVSWPESTLLTLLQRWVGMCICSSAQTCVSQIIQLAVWDVQLFDKCPHFSVMPVYHRMYAHERRPASVSRIEEFQVRTMRICSSGADEDSLYCWCVG